MNGHSSASPAGRKHITRNAFDVSISASKAGGSSGSSARDFPGQIAQRPRKTAWRKQASGIKDTSSPKATWQIQHPATADCSGFTAQFPGFCNIIVNFRSPVFCSKTQFFTGVLFCTIFASKFVASGKGPSIQNCPQPSSDLFKLFAEENAPFTLVSPLLRDDVKRRERELSPFLYPA